MIGSVDTLRADDEDRNTENHGVALRGCNRKIIRLVDDGYQLLYSDDAEPEEKRPYTYLQTLHCSERAMRIRTGQVPHAKTHSYRNIQYTHDRTAPNNMD